MGDMKPPTALSIAMKRFMANHGEIKNPSHWAKGAGLSRQTVADALAGGNTTIQVIEDIAKGAGLAVADLLAYAEDDWEERAIARSITKNMTPDEIRALSLILTGRR